MKNEWYRRRGYRHLDIPVCEKYAERVREPAEIVKHSFSPLIHYTKNSKRYRPNERRTVTKKRPIMYASHRDSCILSYYSWQLSKLLEEQYAARDLAESIVAYRKLGKSNYQLSADVLRFAEAHAPCAILAFDVTGFFDNLQHGLLKRRLKTVLSVEELPPDWYSVFKFATKYRYIDSADLKAHPVFGQRIRSRAGCIGTIAEIKEAGIQIHANSASSKGIPQGTPISSAFSNLYMLDFDTAVKAYCDSIGALYRRYSDDILIVCAPQHAAAAEAMVVSLISADRLEINAAKTEKTLFDAPRSGVPTGTAQYLGFTYYPGGAGIRPSSLSKQWRKLRRSLKRIERAASTRIGAGKATKVFTKSLRRRFTPLQFRNFSSYARRSADAFGPAQKISRQARRLERAAIAGIRRLKMLEP